LIREKIYKLFVGRPVDDQSKCPILAVVRRKKKYGLAKVRIAHRGMSEQKMT
jgi:hypothetical protein